MCMFHRAPSFKGAWVLDPRGSADIAQSLTRAPQLRSDFAWVPVCFWPIADDHAPSLSHNFAKLFGVTRVRNKPRLRILHARHALEPYERERLRARIYKTVGRVRTERNR